MQKNLPHGVEKTSSLQRAADDMADKFIRCRTTTKKCYLKDNLTKSLIHKNAVLRFAKAWK